ncbi:uncharacterized protein ccdc33 [Thalassophryne amazonica]|uniref:uncharacterized protein ccdc33 n=1 Tax=Thalassophryne amazonica TaxID=390379 RepID=UPI0014725CB6|nr:uncharacterized protein ccdc33 [Thalassophryne amazonica]
MADDIIALRIQVAALEGQNSQLRTELSVHQDLSQNLLDSTDIEGVMKTEISERMGNIYSYVCCFSCSAEVSLKVKLASERSKVASQRDIINQLQNELIHKNESEKDLLKLQRVYTKQHKDMQSYQRCVAKIASLEILH